MSSNKEEKSQAADKIKAATLTAAKGLSRAQAERAAAAAARNVNAYGQKEEGPSRWQEKKEAKRQMYLMSTEKAVRLGERKDLKSTMGGTSSSQCQKCFQAGHWTYECKNERVYVSRPSRSQQLKNPKLRQKLAASYDLDNSDALEVGNGGKKNEKSDSGSSSSSSSSEEESSSVSSYSSSSDSEEERRRRRKKRKSKSKSKSKKTGKHRSKRYSSSSESDSEDESSSDSESDDRRSRKKSRKHSRKR